MFNIGLYIFYGPTLRCLLYIKIIIHKSSFIFKILNCQFPYLSPKMNILRAFTRSQIKLGILSSLQNGHPTRSLTGQTSMAPYLLDDKINGLGFIRSNPRTPKPRKRGVTEIRGPYYSAYGKRHWQDIMDTVGHHVDGLKFAGGSFSLMPERSVSEFIDIAHQNEVYVSTVR